MRYFLAIDLGASSGRHILGWLADGRLHTEIVHNFKNEIITINGTKCWDIDRLFAEIIAGLKKCAAIGKIPETVAIDGFGVDFVLLDADDRRIGPAVSYRDSRTDDMEEIAFSIIPQAELYARTGIKSHNFNTIYQLLALKQHNPDVLKQAQSMLLLPNYLSYLLTDTKMTEYTNATTSGLVNSQAKSWDDHIINALGLPRHIFVDMYHPGESCGPFSTDIAAEVGFCAQVVLCASHDTASAVVATPFDAKSKDSALFLSSGTWSLLGAEIDAPLATKAAQQAGFSNEGGYGTTTRFLKNIMGMWMLQSIKRELGDVLSFADLDTLAQASKIESIVDCSDGRFFAPASMMAEVAGFCAAGNQQVPQNPGEYARIIYKSLAASYNDSISEIETLLGKNITHLHIIGGGSQSLFLNDLTYRATGKIIIPGPIEATAIGNIAVQMIAAGVFKNLEEARIYTKTVG